MIFSEGARDWLASATKIAADDLVVTPMNGANSSAVLAVHDARKIREPRFVLRVFTKVQWLTQEPDLAIHEAAALQEVSYCGVDSPVLITFETSDVGFGGPVVLMSRVCGHVELQTDDLNRYCTQLAQTLAKIHVHKPKYFGWSYTSWIDEDNLRVPDWAENPRLWMRAIELWRAGAPTEKSVFLHRDFHPCNVLWKNGKISGVVDWVNACRGPRGVDVAHCRTNLAVLFGVPVADAFRDAYLEIAGGLHHPIWDVASVLSFSLPQPEFYRPWSEFGVEEFDWREMARRNEIYLASVMARAII